MSLKKSKFGAQASERRRKRNEAAARAAERKRKAEAAQAVEEFNRRVEKSIADALQIVACPDWKKTEAGTESWEERKARAERYRSIADDCEKMLRRNLGQTVRFIASEIELGVGLGPYVNQED